MNSWKQVSALVAPPPLSDLDHSGKVSRKRLSLFLRIDDLKSRRLPKSPFRDRMRLSGRGWRTGVSRPPGPSHTTGRAGPHPAVRRVEVTSLASAAPGRRITWAAEPCSAGRPSCATSSLGSQIGDSLVQNVLCRRRLGHGSGAHFPGHS